MGGHFVPSTLPTLGGGHPSKRPTHDHHLVLGRPMRGGGEGDAAYTGQNGPKMAPNGHAWFRPTKTHARRANKGDGP